MLEVIRILESFFEAKLFYCAMFDFAVMREWIGNPHS